MSCPTQKIAVTMKQETLEEAAENFLNNSRLRNLKTLFIEGAKWQAERMCSEEDLRDAYLSFPDEWICFDEWFEQFKNK